MFKWFNRFILLLFLAEMLIPVIGLAYFSIDNGGHVSLAIYWQLFEDPNFQQSLLRSLTVSVLTVVFCALLLTPTIWYAYMYYPRVLKWLEGLGFVSFVFPSVALGLAYVQFFSNSPVPLAGTPNLLPFAFTLLAMPFYIQAVLNRLRFFDTKRFDEAARSLGSSMWLTWWKVQFPLMRPGVITGSMLVFSISMGEFTITQLTTGGTFMTLPMYLQVAFMQTPLLGSAMAVIILLIASLAVFMALVAIPDKRGVQS